jgi:integrase
MAHRRGNRWVARGYDSTLGFTKHLGTFDTRKEAAAAEAQWRLRSRPSGRETCGQFAERWVRDYPRPRKSTNERNAERVRKFARDFARVKLQDVDRPAARLWATQNKGLLPAVRAMFGDALRDGLVDVNPFAQLRLPQPRGRKDIRALTERELVELAAVARDPRMRLDAFGVEYEAMILFAGYVGCRPGELFALQRSDVKGDTVLIERAVAKDGTIGATKNGRSRLVAVPAPARDAIERVPAHPSGLLFLSPRERMWRQTSHHHLWKLLRTLAGHPDLDFYELRHAAATMLLERGLTPWDVALQLGHMDGGQLVMEVYGHPSEQAARGRIIASWTEDVEPLHAVRKRESA